jgi:hypothetical protein
VLQRICDAAQPGMTDEVAHSVSGERVIRAGDVLNVDVPAELGGCLPTIVTRR